MENKKDFNTWRWRKGRIRLKDAGYDSRVSVDAEQPVVGKGPCGWS